jgi:deoxyribodipyrimidine photolyase
MRELNATGFMHNRVRMIVASFLTKHLLIDWRWGEAYFAKKLLDFELASNNGGWQWAAGTGTDAQPYFRVFNPDSQTEKFDKELRYIKKWVPELASLPIPFVHEPWKLTPIEQVFHDFMPGKNYPLPIVNLEEARKKSSDFFWGMRKDTAVKIDSKRVLEKHTLPDRE